MVGLSHTATLNGNSGCRYSRRHCPLSASGTMTLLAVFLGPHELMSPLPVSSLPWRILSSFPLGCSSAEGHVGSSPDIHCLVLVPEAKVGHLNLRPGFQFTGSSMRTWIRCFTSQSLSPHSENGDSMPTWCCCQQWTQTSYSMACTWWVPESWSLCGTRGDVTPLLSFLRPLPLANHNGILLSLEQPCSHLGDERKRFREAGQLFHGHLAEE